MASEIASQTHSSDLERLAINVVRGLAMDAPNKANSGHQGTAMALAPLAHVLFTRVMNYDPSAPEWPDRDRFVLSGGHASMLLYAMLHLTGYDLTLDDIRDFRQWESKTPGHPEAGHTAGVEVTTGPLGQGLGNAVGMAIAERQLRAEWGAEVCDHYVYAIAGDGDLSEGLSHEAASLAGHLGLDRLIAIYDDNRITIDGTTDLSLSDDAVGRFTAYGWQVIQLGEAAEDLDQIEAALVEAKADTDRPTLIVLQSHIGYPSPSLTDDHEAHGLAFGDAEISEAKAAMGIPDEPFWVPEEVTNLYRQAGVRGATRRADWEQRVNVHPDAAGWRARWGTSVDTSTITWPTFEAGSSLATRKASQQCLTTAAAACPGIIGGAADLTGNTGTQIADTIQSATAPQGRQLYFGVREHAMGAALVGAARHGGVIPVGGTFLVFADYMRPAVRLAALSQAKCVFVWTHDSVGVGEDGPTHQPVEQLMSLRTIPGLRVIRPADGNETAGAWDLALSGEGPTALILSRQNVTNLAGTRADKVQVGAYALNDVATPDVVIIGTGSEVQLCVDAADKLASEGIAARAVSMPCWEQFEALSPADQAAVLPAGVPTVSVEAGVTLGWHRYASTPIGIDEFGKSAPGGLVLEKMGFTVSNVVSTARTLLG